MRRIEMGGAGCGRSMQCTAYIIIQSSGAWRMAIRPEVLYVQYISYFKDYVIKNRFQVGERLVSVPDPLTRSQNEKLQKRGGTPQLPIAATISPRRPLPCFPLQKPQKSLKRK